MMFKLDNILYAIKNKKKYKDIILNFKKVVLEESDVAIIDEKCPDELMSNSYLWDRDMLKAYAKKGNINIRRARRIIDEGWIYVSRENYKGEEDG